MNEGTCIHFNGVQNDTCERGVRYDQFARGRPCIQFIQKSARGGTYLKAGELPAETQPVTWALPKESCAFYEEPTAEQVQAYRAERDVHFTKTFAAIAIAGDWRVKPKPGSDRREVVECPVCKGRLHLSQSAYNGHVHGKCETANCVSWME